MELVLSKEKCALISSAMDDCKIASCKDDDRNRVTLEGEIPFGAICRIKCRSVKATRCRCCKAGFEIGKKCPEDDELDGCGLEVDNFALYEGPDANLVPALDWRGCYQECLNRGMNCHAASFVKLRFNSMCWIFNEVTTRYGDEQDSSKDTFGGPTRELFGLRNGKIGRSGGGRKVPPVQNKPLPARQCRAAKDAARATTKHAAAAIAARPISHLRAPLLKDGELTSQAKRVVNGNHPSQLGTLGHCQY